MTDLEPKLSTVCLLPFIKILMEKSILVRRRPSIQWLFHCLGLSSAHTQTSELERQLLSIYAENRMKLVEIGVYQGVTARVLASVMNPDGLFYAVDPYSGGRLGVDFNYFIARMLNGRPD